jgi:hypothetical protein
LVAGDARLSAVEWVRAVRQYLPACTIIADTYFVIMRDTYTACCKYKKHRGTENGEAWELVPAKEASAINTAAQCDGARARIRMRHFAEFVLQI